MHQHQVTKALAVDVVCSQAFQGQQFTVCSGDYLASTSAGPNVCVEHARLRMFELKRVTTLPVLAFLQALMHLNRT
jgi:hypothetical protein